MALRDDNIGLCDHCGCDETTDVRLHPVTLSGTIQGETTRYRAWLCRRCLSAMQRPA